MAAKFEIVQPKPGEFRWVLTSQGRVLARSDAYTRKVSCVAAMESFRKAAPTAGIVDHTAKAAAPPKTVPGTVARKTGRVVGKAAAVVTEVPSLLTSAVGKVVETVTPTPAPRKRTAKAR
jgi:uncharacterized protein YegP (UPF0339 family)